MAVYKEEKTNTWRAVYRYTDWNGERKQTQKRGFKTKREAQAWEREQLNKSTADLDMTFKSFVDLYTADMKTRLKENTWSTKEHIIRTKLLPYFGKLKICKITAQQIITWQNEMMNHKDEQGKPYSPVYLKTVHNQLSAIFNHAVRYYNLRENPCKKAGSMGKKKNREMLFWTKEEYLKFAEAMMDKPLSFYAFEMLYWCGIREGELLALTPADFDFEKGTVSINKSYQRLNGQDLITTPKTEKSNRVITMPQFLTDEIQDYLKMLYGIGPHDRMFTVAKSYLHREMERGAKAAGVKRIRIHDIRHSAVSLLIDMGFSATAMARGDGIHRTSARNMRLTTPKLRNAQQHNEREKESYVNQDIVPERSHLNVHFKKPNGGYLEQFEQMEADGIISTRGIKEDAFRYGELIFDVNSAYFFNHGGYDFAKQFYHDAYQAAIKIVGGEQYILSAVMHADERNRAMSEALGQDVYHYHLHVVYVPVVEKQIRWSKRCKDKSLIGKVKETVMQVSMSKKWASKPVLDAATGEPLKTAKGKPVLKKSYSVLQDDFFQYMLEAGYADVERGERGSSEEHLTVTQFKVEREQARLAELQTEKSEVQAEIGQLQEDKAKAEKATEEAQTELRLLAPKLKHMEKLAAEYSANPEDLLPLPDRMESAKSYREKKSKPLLEKIVKVVRSVYRAYLDLCQKFELLQRKYDTEVPYLKEQLAEVKGENAELQETARDYHRLCRAYGPERVAETVAAVKQQEQEEKEQKRSQKRRHDRDAR